MKITVTWSNANPNTIWGKLASRLGREPTNEEARSEVIRIMSEDTVERAGRGDLPWQKRGAA